MESRSKPAMIHIILLYFVSRWVITTIQKPHLSSKMFGVSSFIGVNVLWVVVVVFVFVIASLFWLNLVGEQVLLWFLLIHNWFWSDSHLEIRAKFARSTEIVMFVSAVSKHR